MSARIIGGIAYDLADGPVCAKYGASAYDGKPTARLVIGKGNDEISIYITNSPAETLAQLEEAVAQLAAFTRRANAPKVVA